MTGESERFATPDGTTLAVRRRPGPGPTALVLHGFTGSAATMAPFIDALPPDLSVVAPDIVGHGDSDAPDRLEPYTMASVVDQVLSLVADHEPTTVHLAGYSMGGRIALSMAARAPWFFASVTSISATAGLADPRERAARHDLDYERAAEVERLGPRDFVTNWLALDLFAPLRAAMGSERLAAEITARSQSSAVGWANSLRGTGTGSMPPVWDRLSALRAPLLALAGGLDGRYVRLADELASVPPDGQAIELAGLGHALPMEDPGATAAAVGDFLKEHS